MRTRVVLFALVIVLVSSFAAVQAQDEMMAVVCDSDLILSLYVAEYSFGFAAVHGQLMTDMPDMALPDLASFDKGQFAPLFDSMMSMMSEDMSGSMMSEDMMNGVVEAMSMDQMALETAMAEMMPEGSDDMMMTSLDVPTVADEPAECTALRDELRHFYTALAYSSTMMSQDM
jgi:hypothetical protein